MVTLNNVHSVAFYNVRNVASMTRPPIHFMHLLNSRDFDHKILSETIHSFSVRPDGSRPTA